MRVLVAMVLLSSVIAYASPAAEKLFQDGKALVAKGKLDEACDAFRKSYALEPRGGTLLNLADCEEKRGRVATAWETFVQARALAEKSGEDPRKIAEADRRAAALAKQLPYITIRTSAPVTLTRNGEPVAAAELDHEVPIDPGRYDLVATAPGHITWTQTIVVELGKKQEITVPALEPHPNATTGAVDVAPPKPATPIDAPPAAKLATRGKTRLGFGLAVGGSTDEDVIYGARIPVQLAPVGPGTIRALGSLFYAKFDDPQDVYREIELYAVGLALEYVQPLAPTFFVAAGAGVGIDYIDDNYANEISSQAWGALRLSPTLRLGRSLDIGLHIQAVKTKDRTVGLGELGVDYFFY